MEKDLSLHKIPPQNLEAEESVLSAILLDNSTLLDVLETLEPDHFYRSAHAKMFTAITELFTKNEPVDLVTLANILKDKGQLEEIGGATYLAKLVDTAPLAVNAQHYAKIIRDKASLRELIESANQISTRCFEDSGDVGFGKTEIAMRAAFKVVEGGYQAVILAPTTILADAEGTVRWIDRFGNKELIYRDPAIACSDPIPLRPRPRLCQTRRGSTKVSRSCCAESYSAPFCSPAVPAATNARFRPSVKCPCVRATCWSSSSTPSATTVR